MNKKLINDKIEEVLIILLTLEWYLESLKQKDISKIKCLLQFFKKELKTALYKLEEYYFEINIPSSRMKKKQSKKTKKVIINAPQKRKENKSSKNSKSKKKNKKSNGRVQRKKAKVGK